MNKTKEERLKAIKEMVSKNLLKEYKEIQKSIDKTEPFSDEWMKYTKLSKEVEAEIIDRMSK